MFDDLHPNLKAYISATPVGYLANFIKIKDLPSSRWSSIFAHYAVDANRVDITVVSTKLGQRTDNTNRIVKNSYSGMPNTTKVTKIDHQGAFDSIHMAPTMLYRGKITHMAPICHHDCLHIHWRWGQEFNGEDYLLGWDGGKPYQKSGAPHIPENQSLKISCTGPRFSYLPSAEKVPANRWQLFMHHGLGYVTKLTKLGETVPVLEWSQLTGSAEFLPFYYHNRMLEGPNGSPDVPRVDESKFGPLENM